MSHVDGRNCTRPYDNGSRLKGVELYCGFLPQTVSIESVYCPVDKSLKKGERDAGST